MPFELILDPRWVIVVALASLVYGLLSPVVVARRLLFLAGTLPHSALLSALLAIITVNLLGCPFEICSVIFSLALVSMVSLLLSRGVKPDDATAIFVSVSVSLTTIALYYILTTFPMETSVWSYIIGDPLLVTWDDVMFTASVSVVVFLLIAPFLREHILIGVDRDFVRLSGIRASIYDAMVVASLAVATVGLLKAVGFVVEHVMVLLPGITASSLARSGRDAVLLGLLLSLAGGLSGLLLSVATGLAPSGVIGIVMLGFYLVSLLLRRR